MPGQDLAALYSAALAFVFPSLVEGFGLPVIEAMACGAPVLCSHIPALVEVVGDAAELFDPESTASITQALRSVLGDAGRQAELRERGMGQAAAFSWEKTARATLELYRGCESS